MNKRFSFRYKKPLKARFIFVFSLFIICYGFLISRLFYLQILEHRHYSKIAADNRNLIVTLPPKRGLILDRNFTELVINLPRHSLYAVPRFIDDKEQTAANLAALLNRDEAEILEKISNDKMFVWISRKLSDDVAEKIRSREFAGMGFVAESERSYPNHSLAAHVLGFVDIDNNGLEGVEKYYDRELRGTDGYKVVTVDAKRRQVDSVSKFLMPPRDGYNVVLTIDEAIQHISEKALQRGVDKYHPKTASAVVMDPSSGDILALCNWPAYNLNDYENSDPLAIRNRAVTDILEPGSSFKIVTATAALSEQVVGLEDEFYCENGSYPIMGRILHDHRPHGRLKFKNIIEVSSNIGTVKVAQELGEKRLYKYIKLFGFGSKTNIDLTGEVGGIAREVSEWTKGSICAIPIGQEIAATIIQLAAAISCIANDGVLVRPRVAKKLLDDKKELVMEFESNLVRRVMTKEICLQMKDILRMVVESGSGKMASIPGYSAAGKTGTAQRLEKDGSYSNDKYNSVFIGFAPVDNPRLAIAVVFVEPRPYYFGGTVAAPVFSEIAGKALRYMGVEPDKHNL